MILEKLAKRGDKRALFIVDAFDPSQERDEAGRWTAGGGSGGAGSKERMDFHTSAAAKHNELAAKHKGDGTRSENLHREAALAHNAAARYHKEVVAPVGHRGGSGETDAVWQSARAAKASSIAHGDPATAPKAEIKVERMREQDPRTTGANQADVARNRLEEFKRSGAQADLAKAFPGSGGPSKDLRTTQTEMPAVKEMPVAKMAPHAVAEHIPMGNAKDPSRMRTDPNKVTQRLEAQPEAKERGGLSREEHEFHSGLHQANMNRKQDKEQAALFAKADHHAKYTKEAKQYDREASEHRAAGRPDQAKISERRAERSREYANNPKESRRDAAAASAGHWASRATEVASKRLPPLREGARSSYSSSTSKGRMPPLREASTQEDRQRISANIRAKGDPVKAAGYMQQEEQRSSLSRGNALSAMAASHASRGNHDEAARTYEEARGHYARAGKETIAAKMAFNREGAFAKARETSNQRGDRRRARAASTARSDNARRVQIAKYYDGPDKD